MSNKVRPQDLASYLENKLLPYWKEKYTKSLQIFEEKKREYESTWWSKLFKCKYENTILDEYYFGWDHERYETWIKGAEIYADRITYHIKTNQEFMEFPNDLSIDNFYSWCAENNIPY